MAKNTVKSVEPNIADLANSWLKKYKLDYKLEQEELNTEIDKALNEYFSKNGGTGGNRPDAKILLQDKSLNYYPILIEYKGYEDKLVKLDSNGQVDNANAKNEPNFKNINSYAVNGAVHYANAILHHTSYTDIIAIGVTGYKNNNGALIHKIGVYYVSKSNFGIGQMVDEYTDLSFLKKEHFDAFIEKVKQLQLTQDEIDRLKERREREINASLVKLNNDIYQNEKGLGENDRVYLVAASIMATLGVPGKVKPLEKSDLTSSREEGNTDGDIMIRKINAFLSAKKLPVDKKDLIIRTLQNTLLTDNINKVENGESQLKRVFTKIVDDLGIYYKIGLTTDFTGKLFNEMYGWLGYAQDKLNDVVLTPSYVASLLVKLARINMKSYVWDFATGSAGLLVAAMNEMLIDAKNNIKSPEELIERQARIKAKQLLGIEYLPGVYMLAILNMILMGDGSSNILNMDSLTEFNGNYGFVEKDKKFPADAFILNPPYSEAGNGMIFVERALSMMDKGYAAIIIQNSAGAGKATEYNKNILKNNTLLASIKMPADIFIGKSSVQTNVYVFRVGEAHQKDDIVKFIDFSNDGYTRTNRKKARKNLFDTDRAKERYQEVVDLVRFGKSKLNIFTEQEYYEGNIDPDNGNDWNQSAPIDTKPNLEDFKNTVKNYLAWEMANVLRNQNSNDMCIGQSELSYDKIFKNIKWKEYRINDLFQIQKVTRMLSKENLNNKFSYPAYSSDSTNNGIVGFTDNPEFICNVQTPVYVIFGDHTRTMNIARKSFSVLDNVKVLKPFYTSDKVLLFIFAVWQKQIPNLGYARHWKIAKECVLKLPAKNNELDIDFIETFIKELETQNINVLQQHISNILSE